MCYKTASAEDWLPEDNKSYKQFKRYYDDYLSRQGDKQRFLRSSALPVGAAGAFGLLGGPAAAASSMLLAAALEGVGWRQLADKEAARYALDMMHRKLPPELEGINTYYN